MKFFEGVEQVSEIINSQHSCVISVGGIHGSLGVSESGEMEVRQQVNINLGSDHRVIDGAVAAGFLHTLRGFLESPNSLML